MMNANRSFVLIGLCSVIACERAPDARSEARTEAAPAQPEPTRPEPPAQPEPPARLSSTTTAVHPTPPQPPAQLSSTTTAVHPAPARPAIAVLRASRESREPQHRAARTEVDEASAGLPAPPSDDPTEYADWLGQLSRADQKRIAAFCRANPVSYQATCGGIGPLHIPLPPRHLLFAERPGSPHGPRSRFLSFEAWHEALTPAQARYVERQCPPGEDWDDSDLCERGTPLVVAFDNQPVAFTTGGKFAFLPGEPAGSDWPTATTPWIALDLDHDAAITSGAELFGSSTILPGGTTARNGFLALAALDTNHDGHIDAGDPAFMSLLLWADRNGDRRSSPDELTALSSVIVSISLDDHLEVRCDARSNCERERATVQWRDAQGGRHDGAVVDVYLPLR